MTTNYDDIAAEYQRAKQQPWRLHLEHYTLFKLLGDVAGRRRKVSIYAKQTTRDTLRPQSWWVLFIATPAS